MATEGPGKNYTNNSAFLVILFLFLKACSDVIALKLWENAADMPTALMAVYAALFGLIFFVIFLLCSYSWFRLRTLCCLGLAALALVLAAVWSLWLAAIVLVCAELLCFVITEHFMRRFIKRRQQEETESK